MPPSTTLRCVGDACRTYVIPHAGNAYRPHLLHPHRVVAYGAAAAATKLIVLAIAVILPAGIFASDEALERQAQALTALTNEVRARARAPALRADGRLTRSADAKATDMGRAGYFAHVGPDGRTPEDFILAAGYPFVVAGENLAMGYMEPRAIMAAWEVSPSHQSNLVDREFADVGIAMARGTIQGVPAVFVAQHFGRVARPAAPPSTPSPRRPAAPITRASVTWTPVEGGGRTRVAARVTVAAPTQDATLDVRGTAIPLAPVAGTTNEFIGSGEVPRPPEEIFRVVTLPSVTVTAADGVRATAAVPWDRIPSIRITLRDQLARARALLPQTFGPLDAASRAVLSAAFALFAIAWLVNLLVEIRRQHVDLLVPGGALVLFLAFLALI